jgi:RHS repeat-associated protein
MQDNGYFYYGDISDVRLSSNSISEEEAISITSTTDVEEVLSKNNTEVVYKFIEFRETEVIKDAIIIEEDNYIYDTNWKDQLKEYNGYEYTYDEIGNPIKIEKDGITYRTFTWEKGRQLASQYVNRSNQQLNDIDIYYKYNDNGIRVEKKIVDKVTLEEVITTYKLSGNKIIQEITDSNKIHYTYDAEDSLVALTYNDEIYYYEKNISGDIIGLIDESGNRVVSYEYDSWGVITSITDDQGNDVSSDMSHIGNINSFRYRGYYYDNDSNYYYLNSRYYDADIRRFINIDSILAQTNNLVGNNLYSYVENNPVNMSDPSGYLGMPNLFPINKWITEQYTKILTYIGVKYASAISGKTLSGELFANSFSPIPVNNLSKSQQKKIADKVPKSSEFKTLVNNSVVSSDGKNFDTGLTSIEFTTGDLHYSIQKADIRVYGAKKGNSWHLTVYMEDDYNFDEYRYGGGFSNFMNNFGYRLEKGNIISSYKWGVSFETIY